MTAGLGLAARFIVWTADPTPEPVPGYTGDPNLITPGVIGFFATFVIALATVFLLIDMTRRMRRVRYRAEVREKLAAEQLDAELAALANGEAPAAGASDGSAPTSSAPKSPAAKNPAAKSPAPKNPTTKAAASTKPAARKPKAQEPEA